VGCKEFQEDVVMKRLVFASVIASSIAVLGCASDPYGRPYDQGGRIGSSAAVGALGGAAAGAILPGVNPVTGAVVGAVLGGVAGAVIKGRQYYRDTRGYCYYVDQYGNPIYDYNARC
jgi:hypothetical protein